MIRFLDWFAGIGGFRLGLERASPEFICVGSCEVDKYAQQVYANHWEKPEWEDSYEVKMEELPNFALFCAGFPCQSFSKANRTRGGINDSRGQLFLEACRVIGATKPDYIFLENVRGILSSQRGHDYLTIQSTLGELGYSLQWAMLNSKDFGVPQFRERVYVIGFAGVAPRESILPVLRPNTLHRAMAYTLDCDGYLRLTGKRPRDEHGKPQLLPIGRRRVRKLTQHEQERLQGFPDGWTDGLTATQRRKCLGNAVTVNVIEAIGRRLVGSICP